MNFIFDSSTADTSPYANDSTCIYDVYKNTGYYRWWGVGYGGTVLSDFICEKTEDNIEEGFVMESLYVVAVVDMDRNILMQKHVVAPDEDTAKFEAGVYDILREKKLTPREVNVVVTKIGNVKVRKEEVKNK